MTDRISAIVLLLVACAAGAQAQEPPDVIVMNQIPAPPPPPPPPGVEVAIGMMAVEPFEVADPVEGVPYSAEVITEVTQDLADGNRIERRTSGTVARDGRGRVRREHQLAAIGPVLPDDARMVTISDPVARVHYSLDPRRKTATASRRGRVVRGPAPPMEAGVAAGGMALGTFTRRVPAPDAAGTHNESVTEQQYEGLHVQVTRNVSTLPAGAIGNVRPIEVVSERWYSPDLRVVVFSRRTDPRFGETVYKLTNIVRAEPEASLFQVPADFKREEARPLPPPPPSPPPPAPPPPPGL